MEELNLSERQKDKIAEYLLSVIDEMVFSSKIDLGQFGSAFEFDNWARHKLEIALESEDWGTRYQLAKSLGYTPEEDSDEN